MIDPEENDSKSWRVNAEHTLSASFYLFEHDSQFIFSFPASLLGHHALEMLLKSALIEAGQTIRKGHVWGHVLRDLAEDLAKHRSDFDKVLGQPLHAISAKTMCEYLDYFDSYFKEFRYPKAPNRVQGWRMGTYRWFRNGQTLD